MDVNTLLPLLALMTFGAVILFAFISKAKVEKQRKSDAPKSTLAADAPSTRR